MAVTASWWRPAAGRRAVVGGLVYSAFISQGMPELENLADGISSEKDAILDRRVLPKRPENGRHRSVH
jgi:hypothetical protein